MGFSVTHLIKKIKQPHGGYLPLKLFTDTQLEDNVILFPSECENVHPSVIGLVIDYLTRYLLTDDLFSAFSISLMGAEILCDCLKDSLPLEMAHSFLSQINGLNDTSILNACKLTVFDQVRRANRHPIKADFDELNPNYETLFNIKTMVKRSLNFFELYGPITSNGFSFEGGYTKVVTGGDGDFLTKDGLWDFKVKKLETNKKVYSSTNTLQILLYYVLGMHSFHKEKYFLSLKNLGFFNPRSNVVTTVAIKDIPLETIKTIENEVICYEDNLEDEDYW